VSFGALTGAIFAGSLSLYEEALFIDLVCLVQDVEGKML